jgi:hypothetical protein
MDHRLTVARLANNVLQRTGLRPAAEHDIVERQLSGILTLWFVSGAARHQYPLPGDLNNWPDRKVPMAAFGMAKNITRVQLGAMERHAARSRDVLLLRFILNVFITTGKRRKK